MPTIEEEIERLGGQSKNYVASYQTQLQRLLNDLQADNLTRKEEQRIISEINALLNELDTQLTDQAEQAVESIYERSVALTLVALGVYLTADLALQHVRSDAFTWSRLHSAYLRSEVGVVTDDVLAATQNTRRRVKRTIRQITAQRLREGLQRQAGTREVRDKFRKQARKQLGDAANFAIRDAAGRRWKLDTYVETVVTTKLAQAHVEATTNEAQEQGAGYVVVSRHPKPCPKCAPYEGRVLRINDDVEGDHPTLLEARSRGLFHPRCKHSITATRKP